MRTVALATCAEVPELDEDGPALVAALRERGVEPVAAVWDDPAVDWGRFELVVLRSTWDYAERRDEFLAWIDRLPRVVNPPVVVRWNSDKAYLGELAAAGVPVVPTTFIEPGDALEPFANKVVLKPRISAGGRNTARYEAHELELARHHLEALHAAGRPAMVQPYLDGIDVVGEAALIWIGGEYSHAITKGRCCGRARRPAPGCSWPRRSRRARPRPRSAMPPSARSRRCRSGRRPSRTHAWTSYQPTTARSCSRSS